MIRRVQRKFHYAHSSCECEKIQITMISNFSNPRPFILNKKHNPWFILHHQITHHWIHHIFGTAFPNRAFWCTRWSFRWVSIPNAMVVFDFFCWLTEFKKSRRMCFMSVYLPCKNVIPMICYGMDARESHGWVAKWIYISHLFDAKFNIRDERWVRVDKEQPLQLLCILGPFVLVCNGWG